MKKFVVSAGALLMLAGAVNATITAAVWREVNNASGAGDPFAPGFPGSFRTFDLFLVGDTVGEAVNAVNAGFLNSAEPFRINTVGTIFHHQFGGDSRAAAEPGLAPSFHAVPYDTFVTFGGSSAVVGAFGGFAGTPDLSGNNGNLRATWFAPAGSPAHLAAGLNIAELWIMRVSISGTQLGGAGSSIQVGTPTDALIVLQVANAFIPTPGATALLGLAGLTGLRRRR